MHTASLNTNITGNFLHAYQALPFLMQLQCNEHVSPECQHFYMR